MNVKKTIGIGAIGVLAASVIIVFGTDLVPFGDADSGTASAGAPGDGTAGGIDPETQLGAVEAVPGSISITVEGPAVVEPYRQLDIRSATAGTVVEALDEGTAVSAEGVIVRLDGSAHRAALQQAELNLDQAEVDLERARLAVGRAERDLAAKESLLASGSITRNERDTAAEALATARLEARTAEIRVSQSNLAVETATRDLAATEIRAPYGGVVLLSNVGAGDVVSSGTVFVTFADVSRLRLRAEVDEFDIGKVQPGMEVMITADSLGDESVLSTVERVSPAAEVINNISIFTVSAVVRADQAPLLPGLSADLTVLVSDDTGLIVPSPAVSTVRGRAYLDVYENDAVETKRVVAGTDDGRNIVILDGLEEGALVVVPETPGFTLTSGTLPGATGSTGSSIIPIPMPGAGGSR
ncbi:MAG: efflux RND transporter periplasmic adaptor subunit [Spirochaeta sp.]|jgi:HlyD family secretion protein|nr:efflux RND transporter periplasmic adaptor subunit [Spirochaeta sp.]